MVAWQAHADLGSLHSVRVTVMGDTTEVLAPGTLAGGIGETVERTCYWDLWQVCNPVPLPAVLPRRPMVLVFGLPLVV